MSHFYSENFRSETKEMSFKKKTTKNNWYLNLIEHQSGIYCVQQYYKLYVKIHVSFKNTYFGGQFPQDIAHAQMELLLVN